MKHVILDNNWKYQEEPFPAYHCNLVFGRNKKDFTLLPVKDVKPIETKNGILILPQDEFKVVKTKDNTIFVVSGSDTTSRCLGFVGVDNGFRGSSGYLREYTTANILASCSAQNRCEGHTTVAALFDINQKVVFFSNGRRSDDIIIFEWSGQDLSQKRMTKKEWEILLCGDIEVVEEL